MQTGIQISFLYVCMVNTIYLLSSVVRSIRKLGSSYYSTEEDLSLRIKSSSIINLCGVSTKLNKYRYSNTQHTKGFTFLVELQCSKNDREGKNKEWFRNQ